MSRIRRYEKESQKKLTPDSHRYFPKSRASSQRSDIRGRVVYEEHTLVHIENGVNKTIYLDFKRKDGSRFRVQTRHAILCLPKSPLTKLNHCFDSQTQEDLEAVFGFPLLKCIFLVKKPWWNEKTPVQSRASSMPTREVHYYYDQATDEGLVMLYTDRPGTQYWAPFVKNKKAHDQAEITEIDEGNQDEPLVERFFRYLAGDIYSEIYADENSTGKLTDLLSPLGYSSSPSQQRFNSEVIKIAQGTDIAGLSKALQQKVEKFGIRDWSREPYGAACHTWYPGAKSWDVLKRLKSFSLPGSNAGNVHICGEAYCDYNGFIEGSLRSADNVLESLL